MDLAPRNDTSAEPHARERCTQRAQALAAVKFMGLAMPVEPEPPPPTWLDKVRGLLFRA